MKYMSTPKNAAVKEIDIDIADILDHKYRYLIDIGKAISYRYRKGDIDPPLLLLNA